jgi:hypothetical protein
MARLWDTEPELIPFASPEELERIKNGLFVVDTPLVEELRRRLNRWRAQVPKPTREQMLATTRDENKKIALFGDDTPQFWEGLEAEWRRKQKLTAEDVFEARNPTPEQTQQPPPRTSNPSKPIPLLDLFDEKGYQDTQRRLNNLVHGDIRAAKDTDEQSLDIEIDRGTGASPKGFGSADGGAGTYEQRTRSRLLDPKLEQPWEPDENRWSPAALKWLEQRRRAGKTFKNAEEANAAYLASQRPEFGDPSLEPTLGQTLLSNAAYMDAELDEFKKRHDDRKQDKSPDALDIPKPNEQLSVARKHALLEVLTYCWDTPHLYYIAGGFLVGGGLALGLSFWLLAELLFAIGIALFVAKGIHALWGKENRRAIAAIFTVVGIMAIAFEVGLIEWKRYHDRPAGIAQPSAEQRPNDTKPQQSPEAENSTKLEHRLLQKTVRQLLSLYEGRTALEADKLMEPFKGEWIRVSGKVFQVSQATSGEIVVYAEVTQNKHTDRVAGSFQVMGNPEKEKRLRQLGIGEQFSFDGKINKSQDEALLYLIECEYAQP